MTSVEYDRRYCYRIECPGHSQHGQQVTFGKESPPMHAREIFQLADGTMAHVSFVGPVSK